MTPYYTDPDGTVALYLGDCREVLPALGVTADLVIADPPYGETSLAWDRWPNGWPALAAKVASSMWCFGSMRMFLERGTEFTAAGWKYSQDVIWEKTCGTSAAADRFNRIHEIATYWYRGQWRDTYRDPQRERYFGPDKGVKRNPGDRMAHIEIRGTRDRHEDDGRRLVRSVFKVPNMRGRAIHPTEKPLGILLPLLEYACPPGGLVVDPFAGSGSALDAARKCGRRAVGIEADERYAERAARRLSQLTLDGAS